MKTRKITSEEDIEAPIIDSSKQQQQQQTTDYD